MSENIVEIKELVKYYPTNAGVVHAVDNVSLRIKKGETLGVVGESGCGKTTLGRCIMNLVAPTSGEVLFKGNNIYTADREERRQLRRNMQIIFQDPYASLDPRNTVYTIIAEALRVNRVCGSRAELDERVNEIMQVVGLSPSLSMSYPHEMDGGRRQRIGIARALVLNPEFIVCDEPVSALDVSIQAQILNLMMDIQEERQLSYMFISHDMSVVKHVSTQIAVMYMGEVVEMAETDEIFAHPLHPYTRALMKSIPTPDINNRHAAKEIIEGEITNPIDPGPGCRFAGRCPYRKPECTENIIPLTRVSGEHLMRCLLV